MRILFVRTYCPYTILYGAELRGSRIVSFLQNLGQVDLLTLCAPTELSDREYMKKNFKKSYHFDQKGEHVRLTSMEKLLHLLPWQITGHYAKDFQEQLNGIMEENQYDLVFIFKLEPVFYFLQLPAKWHKKIIIDFDDILSDLYMNHYKIPLTAVKNSYSLKLYEQKALNQFKRVLVSSNDAVSKIPMKYRNKVGIVPNVFPVNKEHFFKPSDKQNHLLFVGSLDYFPNTEGLKWFFNTVWPEVKKSYPELKMTVIGKGQRDLKVMFKSFGSPADVEIFLNVQSVMPYYEKCFATIVPLLNGSGTRLKILESAAYGRPVLSTMKGMEGLDFKNEENIFVFKDALSFMNGYKALLDNNEYIKLAQNAFQVLEKQYSPNAFTSGMSENWQIIKSYF